MTRTGHVGGSLLPSNSHEILQPMTAPFGTLQVRVIAELDTHGLFWLHNGHEAVLAIHPNGFSCHELAKRMVARDYRRATQQLEYIMDCGGIGKREEAICNIMAIDA